MSVWTEIYKKLSGWFIEKLWPFIQEMIIAVILEFVRWLFERIRKIFNQHNQRQEEFANSKAEEESTKAKEAKTPEEAENHERIAELWREVADQFRVENERLKRELEEALAEAVTKAKQNIKDLKAEDALDLKDAENIRLKNINLLPQLSVKNDSEAKQ